MSWVWAVLASADLGRVGRGDSERRRQRRDRNCCKPRFDLSEIGRLKALEQELSRRLGLSRTVSAKPGAPDLGRAGRMFLGVANWRPCEFDWKPRSENGFN